MPSITAIREAHKDPVLPEGPVMPVNWTAELLGSLDWRRVVEITRALAALAGHQLGETKITVDSGAVFTMTHQQNRWLVRLAPWNQWVGTRECVQSFAKELLTKKHYKGIYIAPLGFSLSAVHIAQEAGIDMIDAESLAARLRELPAEHSQFYYDITTAGDAWTPSCPSCLKRLTHVEESSAQSMNCETAPDVSYRSNDIIAEPVVARVVEVMRDCEVQFLSEVRARDLVINGVAQGTFLCEGSLLMNPGAVLYGSVAARSVLVRPGAVLHGQTRILQGKPEPMDKPLIKQFWRCANPRQDDKCAKVSLLPH